MKASYIVGTLMAALVAASGCESAPAAGVERGEHYFTNYCAPCHSADGSGNADVAAPAIAGLPDWYVQAQLDKFRSGARGTHFDDIEGMRMRPMARTLLPDDVALVAQYVASLPPVKHAATLHGDAAKGKTSFATCQACHGADGKGNQALNAPSLLVQDDWYLAKQITKFKAGIRGTAAGDTTGATMRPMAMTLADDQAIADVVAHIQTLR